MLAGFVDFLCDTSIG